MEVLETPNLAPSVRLLSKPGESGVSPSHWGEHPCACNPGRFCVLECIHLDNGMDADDFLIDVRSGEDVCV